MYENAEFQRLVAAGNPIGEVSGIDHDLVRVNGLEAVASGALVLFENGFEGLVRESTEKATVVLNLSPSDMPMGTLVVLKEQVFTVAVGEALIGRIVNAMGQPIDGKGPVWLKERREVFKEAPGVIKRAKLSTQLTTGVAMVDFLFPILLGQRMAILGDSRVGKSALLTQVTESQIGTDRTVIYCLIAKRRADVDATVGRLAESGAMSQTIILVSSVFDSLAHSYLAPYVAAAMGEYFWYQGKNVIMVYDDLTSHAKVYREINLISGGNPGRESYPGDMFYAHSSLLERAGKLADGGGTMTALPVVLAPNNDITAFLPTGLVSITDGQVVFDTEKFRGGIRPAVNHGLSVSRVGGSGQTSRQKKLTSSIVRTMFAHQQAAEFARFGAQLSPEAQASLALGNRIYEAFKQPVNVVYTLEEQELILTTVMKTPPEWGLNVDATKKMAKELAAQGIDDFDAAVQKLIDANAVKPEEPEEEEAAPEPVAVGAGDGKKKKK